MPLNRSHYRNVRFYDASNPTQVLGGFRQNGSITEATFLMILEEILLIVGDTISVQERTSQHVVTRANVPLQPGEYDIHCNGSINLSDEPIVGRLITHNETGRPTSFRDGIRARDGRCVISGRINPNAAYDDWTTFEAAHIFPINAESHWNFMDYGRWITDMGNVVGTSRINSRQNGLLLRSHIHDQFGQYLLSVNPRDNNRIVVFGTDLDGLDGRTLDPICCNPGDPHRVSEQLLWWHFRQAVLTNMKGQGEPIFEHDFPPGTDMMAEIREGPRARERLEMEFAARLRHVAQEPLFVSFMAQDSSASTSTPEEN